MAHGKDLYETDLNCINWEWDEIETDKPFSYISEQAGELVASEFHGNLEVHIESGGEDMGQIIVSSSPFENMFVKFDMAEMMEDVVYEISSNSHDKSETIRHLVAFRSKYSSLVEYIDKEIARHDA